jgi:hypothetical protein
MQPAKAGDQTAWGDIDRWYFARLCIAETQCSGVLFRKNLPTKETAR